MLTTNGFTKKDNGLRTHTRYVGNIYLGIYGQELKFNIPNTQYIEFSQQENEKVIKKISIILYTLKTIIEEKKICDDDIDFTPLAISWLWIKGYYCIFHLMSIIIAYEKKDSRYILNKEYNAHVKIKNLVTELLHKKPFTLDFLNEVYSGHDLENFVTIGHKNLQTLKNFESSLYKLSIKKVFNDDKDKPKVKRTKNYSFFALAMNYRERFNYQGFQYLECENDADQEEIRKFYIASYQIIYSISKSLIDFLIENTSGEIKTKFSAI